MANEPRERSPQHVDAWEFALARITKFRETAAAVLTLGLTYAGLAIAGLGKDGEAVGIGAGCALFVGLVVIPGGGYIWRRFTYPERLILTELAAVRTALRDMGDPTTAPAATQKKKTVTVVPHNVLALRDEQRVGLKILKRCPQSRGMSAAKPPPALVKEANAWIKKVTELLEDWPDHQAQFAGPLSIEVDAFGSFAPVTQEMMKRLDLLSDIVKELVASEGRKEERDAD